MWPLIVTGIGGLIGGITLREWLTSGSQDPPIAEQIGQGAGNAVSAFLKEILPYIVIGFIFYVILKRGKII